MAVPPMPTKSKHTPSTATRRSAARGSVGDTTLRIGATIGLPAVLQSLGASPAQLLAEVGLELALFDSPDNLLSFSARGRLLEHCVARTGCEHLGLLVGQRASLQSLGLVGSLVKYSPDLGTALHTLARFFRHHARGAKATLTVDGQLAYFGYQIVQPGTKGTDQVADGALAAMLNIMQSLCGPDWKPSQVTLAHRKPANVEPFRQFFRAPLLFDAEQNALVFLAEWLTYRLPVDDPELRRQLTEQIRVLEARHRDSFPEQVRSVLRAALLTWSKSNAMKLPGRRSWTPICKSVTSRRCSAMPTRVPSRARFAAGAGPRRPNGGQQRAAGHIARHRAGRSGASRCLVLANGGSLQLGGRRLVSPDATVRSVSTCRGRHGYPRSTEPKRGRAN